MPTIYKLELAKFMYSYHLDQALFRTQMQVSRLKKFKVLAQSNLMRIRFFSENEQIYSTKPNYWEKKETEPKLPNH